MCQACPNCSLKPQASESRTVFRLGFFRRKFDRKRIQRYRCTRCGKCFSDASFDPCFRQHRRDVNPMVFRLLASLVSQRRISYVLNINRKTVRRKFLFLGPIAKLGLSEFNRGFPPAQIVQFDELETFEHTKCKPVSVMLAVEEKSRRFLSYDVSQMPAKGRLSHIALKKYGVREDHRPAGRHRCFQELKILVDPQCIFKSDMNPHYPEVVKTHFPDSLHWTTKGGRGAITGQGELKKQFFDPLFSLNHTCATMRGDINRLIRKTWCTTKLIERLDLHIAIMALYHNMRLYLPKKV